jgi:hypothetical protein
MEKRQSYIKGEPIDLFMRHVKVLDSGCWEWQGATKPGGYGVFGQTKGGVRKTHNAHRWIYINQVGEIPDGLTIDHLCKKTKCVNPQHMEVVTLQEKYTAWGRVLRTKREKNTLS